MPERTLDIVPYDPLWPEAFEDEADRIRRELGDLAQRVDHVGSTSVPGLAANVCPSGGDEERRHLAFRDYLRDHPEVALEYTSVKRLLASRFSAETFESRNAYSEAKSEFIASVLEAALTRGYPRNLQ
jgi:GrpB-like predicted nucleotidyltransferase (UPF0157 family)